MNTQTEQTGYSGVLNALRPLASEHRAAREAEREEMRREAERVGRELEAAQRRAAEEAAAEFIGCAFPHTLAHVLPPQAWQGYPPGTPYESPNLAACAVAYLGEGLFLVHTQRRFEYDVYEDLLMLLTPCPCGAYVTTLIVSEELLCSRVSETAAAGLCAVCQPF